MQKKVASFFPFPCTCFSWNISEDDNRKYIWEEKCFDIPLYVFWKETCLRNSRARAKQLPRLSSKKNERTCWGSMRAAYATERTEWSSATLPHCPTIIIDNSLSSFSGRIEMGTKNTGLSGSRWPWRASDLQRYFFVVQKQICTSIANERIKKKRRGNHPLCSTVELVWTNTGCRGSRSKGHCEIAARVGQRVHHRCTEGRSSWA